MEYTIITEENYKEILEKLTKLTKNKIYTYEYGVYKECTNINDVIQKKDNLKYTIYWPHVWVCQNGKSFNRTPCGVIMSNADIIEVEEHWLYQDYINHKNSQESEPSVYYDMGSSWLLTKPLIYISLHNDQVLILSEGDCIKITENEIKILTGEYDSSNSLKYVRAYEFKYVTTVTDEESASLKASKESYIKEVNDYYNEFTMNDMLREDCSNSEVDDELCELYDPTDDCE